MAIRWGILGSGKISQRNMVPAMLAADNADVIACMDIDKNTARDVAEKFSIPKYYTTSKELLTDKDIQAIYVATPVYLHAEKVIEAAKHGKHVLCEKPMALTLQDCKEMMAACRANNVHLAMGFMLRFHPHHLKAKELIDSGAIGQIVKARVQWNFMFPPQEGVWSHDPALSGGGSLMDVGVHGIDLLRFLVGDIEEVSALSSNVVFPFLVEDAATVLLKFRNGSHGLIETSFAVDTKNSPNGVEIYGTKGVITTQKTVSCFVGGTMKTCIDGEEQSYPVSEVINYQKEVESFGRKIESREPCTIDENGLESLRVILAAYESAKLKKTVCLT